MADSHQNHHRKGMAGIRQSLRHKEIEEMAIFPDLSLERLNLSDKEMADNLQIFLQTPRHTAEVSFPYPDYRKNQAGVRARIRVVVG